MEHLFFAAMQIKSLHFEEDGESTFTVVREESEEKIVYGRMVLAGTTADHPEERPPPEPDPSQYDEDANTAEGIALKSAVQKFIMFLLQWMWIDCELGF